MWHTPHEDGIYVYLNVGDLADDAPLLDPLDEGVARPVIRDGEAQGVLRLQPEIYIQVTCRVNLVFNTIRYLKNLID